MTMHLSEPGPSAVPLRRPSRADGHPTLTIDLAAIAANTERFCRIATGEVMAVVKADAFGHGAAEVARTALSAGATRLGVATLDEALALREAGLRAPMLSWLNPVDSDWVAAAAAEVDVAVPSVERLAAVAAAGGARVHLQIDTGLARDGASPRQWVTLCRAARSAERAGRIRVVGLMGHLPCADVAGDRSTSVGRTRFAWALDLARSTGLRPHDLHLAATAATLLDPRSHRTMSRIGAGLYGIDPTRTTSLRPAMTLSAPIVETRVVGAGTPVGYGHAWTARRTSRLGLLPLGYADGLPRAAGSAAEVLIDGRRAPVAGRISMDMTVVDLTETSAGIGDVATVFGPGASGEPTVREWADWSGLLEHEVVTGIGARPRRVHKPAVVVLRGLS